MAIEKEQKTEHETAREYLYSLCPTCREKVNINVYYCPKCGNPINKNANTGEYVVQVVYGSKNPENYIYCIRLNDYKHCPGCHVTQMEGKPCKYAPCYATNKGIEVGNCGKCERYEPVRFTCCRRKYQQEVEKILTKNTEEKQLV
jgi:hypothetical protein